MSEITTIRGGALEARVDAAGAQLMGLSRDGVEYLWQGDERFWPRRAPVLFPIVGCLRGDRATSAAGDVSLKRHGIARLHEHRLVGRTDSSVTYELASTAETRAAYPFDFRLDMTYAIEGDALAQTFAVTNTGSVELPFTLGGHPAFNVPVPGCDEGFSDYELVFDEAWTAAVPTIDGSGLHDFGHAHELFRDADRLALDHGLFERLLTLVFVDVPGRRVTLRGRTSGHGVEVRFDGFDYLGVWTASAESPFVALEPWCGCATAYDESDVFEEKRGIIRLAPGETCERTFSMRPF